MDISFIKLFYSKIELLERKFGLDLMYYIKNTPNLMIVTIITMVFGLISSTVFARFTSTELYGSYTYLLTILSTLSVLSVSGMNIAIQRASSRGHDQVFVDGTKVRFKWSLIGSIVIAGIGFYYLFNGNAILGKCFLISALFFPVYSSFDTFLYQLKGKMKFKKYALFSSLITIIPVISNVVVILLLNDLLFIFVAYLISYSVIQFYLWYLTYKKEPLNNRNDEESIKYGKTLTLQGLFPAVVTQMDNILIANFLSFSDLAIFSIAVYGQKIATTPRGYILELIFPKVAKMDNVKSTKIVLEKVKYIVLISVIICGIIAFLIPFFTIFFFSQKYAASIFYAELLLISEVVASPGGFFTQVLKAQGRSKALWKLTMYTRSIEAVLFLVMIPLFGILGAVIVRILNNALTSIISFWIIKKH